MTTITLTPPQLHEVITALHRNRSKIQQRMRWSERHMDTPEEQEKRACDPNRTLYMETIRTCREGRIATIDALLAELTPHEDERD